MKGLFSTVRLVSSLGLAAGLFFGCQDLLNQKDDTATPTSLTNEQDAALRLSIKDDSTCKEHWAGILDARSKGSSDSAGEKRFLTTCVKEIKVEKDRPLPVIPPNLVPDSSTRCRWIVGESKVEETHLPFPTIGIAPMTAASWLMGTACST